MESTKHHNQQIRLLIDINKYLTEECGDANSVYYSVENNTIGEAALQSVAEIGEENIPVYSLANPKHMATVEYTDVDLTLPS